MKSLLVSAVRQGGGGREDTRYTTPQHKSGVLLGASQIRGERKMIKREKLDFFGAVLWRGAGFESLIRGERLCYKLANLGDEIASHLKL